MENAKHRAGRPYGGVTSSHGGATPTEEIARAGLSRRAVPVTDGGLVLLAMDVGGRLVGMVEVDRVKGKHGAINDATSFRKPQRIARRLWGRGVHVAPWCDAPTDTVLVAVDERNRLVAMMTANTACQVPGVRRDLGALLSVEPHAASL